MNKQLQERINRLRWQVARALDPSLQVPFLQEQIHVNGVVRVREVPFETREEWEYWWLPEVARVNGELKVIRPARMSEQEKDRYTVAGAENLLTTNGITQLLTYVGSASGSAAGFAQYFALGSSAINKVDVSDTSVAGEYFRGTASVANITGVQIDLSMFCLHGVATGNITNTGFFGVNASATLGSGTLMTHNLCQYNKASGADVTFDYLLNYT